MHILNQDKGCEKKLLKASQLGLLILYLLNCTDIIFTLMFNQTGNFIELNPFMQNVISDWRSAILLKIAIPAILFVMLGYRIKSASISQLRIVKSVVYATLILYAVINIMHIITLFVLLDNRMI